MARLLLLLAFATRAQPPADSTTAARAESRGEMGKSATSATDSVHAPSARSPLDSARGTTGGPSRAPLPWLPLEFHRWTMAELEDTAAEAHAFASGSTVASKDSSKLKIEGYKTIRVGVGGSGGVALDQTLLLDATGDLSPGVHLNARISDGNLPLSSQGSSAALRDVDELWIDVSSEHWGTRLGDQDWNLGPGLGSGFQRRLRGWSGTWKPDGAQFQTVFGGPRARWSRLALDGVEGQQEGYVLVRNATGLHGAVVPGSERVRVNGETMVRGGDADYTVRYSQGLLDFATRRRIHASDRIEVEFQAADLDYERSFAGGSARGVAYGARWEAWGAREADQSEFPLAYSPDSSTRRILAKVGADSSKALDSSGARIPLPRQTGEAGFRLGVGDSTSSWIRTDFRGATLDRNVLSSLDAPVSGIFAASEVGTHLGDYLGSRGAGRWTLGLRGEIVESGFQGLSSPDTLGSNSSDWAGNPGRRSGGRSQGGGSVAWEAYPGVGVWTRAQAMEQEGAFLSLASGRAGLDRGQDRQILAYGSWSRFDDGLPPLDLLRGTSRVAWPAGSFVPRAEADVEVRDARVADSASRRFSRWASAGTRWTGPWGWVLDGEGSARRDATDLRGTEPGGVDTAKTVGVKGSAKWGSAAGSVDLDADWSNASRRARPGYDWTESDSWIGEAAGSSAPFPGLRATARWRLSTSAYQPEIAAYDTVPAGTGTFVWDSVLREAVPSDKGNLRYAGTRLDTSKPAVRASQRSVGGEVEIVPGRISKDLRGFLADLGARIHGELQQTDSSDAVQLLPSWSDAVLSRSPQAQSLLETSLWWTREGKRLEGDWSRRLAMGMSSQGMREREMVEKLSWASPIGDHRLELLGEHGDLHESEPGYARAEERWRGEPSLALHPWKSVEIKPGAVGLAGSGIQSGTSFRSNLVEPYLVCSVQLPRGFQARTDLRRASVDANGPVGSRITEGYPAGDTWRASAGLDWSWKDHVQAHGDWTLRLEPGRPAFQKLSMEARASF